ncbi:MAG: translation initiation factor IF-3 [Patescibacteria group bacterium]|nr:translation initiation factor IF-3 [Patescibacteria group bacterium]
MKYYRLNNQITAPKVRLIDEEGKHLGVFSIEEARRLSQQKNLDLVEISPKETPPVVRIVDFGKFLYETKKKERSIKKRKQEIKGLRLSLRVGRHDLEVKKKQVLKFLEAGQRVKIELVLRGREKTHFDLAKKIIDEFIKGLGEIKIEQPLVRQGDRLTVLISR